MTTALSIAFAICMALLVASIVFLILEAIRVRRLIDDLQDDFTAFQLRQEFGSEEEIVRALRGE